MLVDGPHPEITAARHRDLRGAEPAEQRPHKIIGGPHLPGQVVRHGMAEHRTGIHFHGVFVDTFHHRAEIFQNIQAGRDVGDIRYIFNAADAIGQQGRRQDRDDGVFRSADFHFTKQGIPSADQVFFQSHPTPHEF